MNKPIKIIIGPSKTFNKVKVSNNKRPKYLSKAKVIFFEYIKNFSLEQTKSIYKLSDKKALEVYKMHQKHGQELFNAIEVFGGMVFKELELNKYDNNWLNEHVLILDPLYGPLKPFDSIGLYRLDLKVKIGLDLIEYWKEDIENELKGFEIINLSSQEYSSFLKDIKDIKQVELDSSIKQIKQARGRKLHQLILKFQK